jgi:hypothetical protein
MVRKMSEQVTKWISELAVDIHKVIKRYDAKPRFGEMMEQCVETHNNEIDKHCKWSERRTKHFEDKVQSDPRMRDEQAGPPQEGWQWETSAIHTFEQTPSGQKRISKLISAWLPPELSSIQEPKIVHLLPLSREHELSLCEKYTLLAAVYDCARKGTDSISPWQWSDKAKPQPTLTTDACKCLSFEFLCDSVTQLSLDNKNWLEAILHDVEIDLKSLKPQQTLSNNDSSK